MKRIHHCKGKVLAVAPAIAIAGLTLHSAPATAEVINSASPVNSEVIQVEEGTRPGNRPLEAVSTNASDLVVEALDPPPMKTLLLLE